MRPDETGIEVAADLLRAGRLVAFPTETVYGLGALATDAAAVAAIYAAKGRPARNPLIVHVPASEMAATLAEMPAAAEALAQAFWPGPLTLVLPRRLGGPLADAVSAGGASVGLRVPAHPVAQALLRAVDGPVAAPSANPSGRVSPTTAAHVLDPDSGLGGRIDAVLDGGPCPVGVESTIVAVGASGAARILRPGGITAEALEAVLGASSEAPVSPVEEGALGPLISPGQFASHYAPRARLRLAATEPRPGEWWLGFGPDPDGVDPARSLSLSPSGDLREAAARLFEALRHLDVQAAPGEGIAVAPIPAEGLGIAINDRLARAAAPRG
ncbi:MAG: L-threonylcarbamoyladenylate synthase [Pseudomonadota bacterium]